MGFPVRLERTMVADLTGQAVRGNAADSHRQQSEKYWDAIRIDQTDRTYRMCTRAQVPSHSGARFVGYPREIRLKPASDTIYSYSHRSMTGPYARAAGIYHALTAMCSIC